MGDRIVPALTQCIVAFFVNDHELFCNCKLGLFC